MRVIECNTLMAIRKFYILVNWWQIRMNSYNLIHTFLCDLLKPLSRVRFGVNLQTCVFF